MCVQSSEGGREEHERSEKFENLGDMFSARAVHLRKLKRTMRAAIANGLNIGISRYTGSA